jgi:1,4-alpha-glucan branching enzyme
VATLSVRFTFITGLTGTPFTNARLRGSWDAAGRHSEQWTAHPMETIPGPDGCLAFTRTVDFDAQQTGTIFTWGVEVDGPAGQRQWAILTEESRDDSTARTRRFRLDVSPGNDVQHEVYYLHQGRRLGAQKYFLNGEQAGIQFSVWAPNASAVEVCIGNLWHSKDASRRSLIDPDRGKAGARALESRPRGEISGGYIDGGDPDHPWGPFPLRRGEDGVWVSDPTDPEFADFARFDHVPYMFRITTPGGARRYRTDLYSRCQIGYGTTRPSGPYTGLTTDLDGSVSCSVIVDPDNVTTQFMEAIWPEMDWTAQDQFFASPPHPRLAAIDPQDLVIYELHIGALGVGRRRANEPGTLEDAVALLNYLEELGVNAVELLPLSEFGGGGAGWGYATSHYFALEYAGGGRDQYKWFIRECHARGIAVILDVVYNHYSHDAERAEWMFDADDNDHERNSYYWYEGRTADYPTELHTDTANNSGHPRHCGGYVDNVSSGWAPRYWEEMVRSMFVSSAVVLMSEFKVDGFRVDQTTSIRSYNGLHRNGRSMPSANAFGAKLLRELTRTLRFINPRVMLFAEDHDNWSGVTQPPDEGGLGFDAGWYADFYHHLIGDTDKGSDYAKLLKTSGLGDDRPLAMDYFASALQNSGGRRVVYHESHDEAGNGQYTDRTINVAVNGAPLTGDTRRYAEARCRFAAGVTLLSAGIPMFLFGEEVGAHRKFVYNGVLENREDLQVLRQTTGASLFGFYRALIRLRLAHPGLRSRNIDVVFVHNEHRLLIFRRWSADEEFLVVASLNNRPYDAPNYRFVADRLPMGAWREVFNSDAAMFGGWNVGNAGATIHLPGGLLECVVPANGVVVFKQEPT